MLPGFSTVKLPFFPFYIISFGSQSGSLAYPQGRRRRDCPLPGGEIYTVSISISISVCIYVSIYGLSLLLHLFTQSRISVWTCVYLFSVWVITQYYIFYCSNYSHFGHWIFFSFGLLYPFDMYVFFVFWALL